MPQQYSPCQALCRMVTCDRHVFDDPRITAVGLLVEAHAGLTARFTAQFEEHGLSAVEFEVLIRLARSPRQPAADDRPRRADLPVHQRRHPGRRPDGARRPAPPPRLPDRPAQLVRRGHRPPAWQRLDEILPGHLRLIEQWFTGQLDPTRCDALLDGLRRVRDAVHPGATAGSTDPAPSRRAGRRLADVRRHDPAGHRQKNRQNPTGPPDETRRNRTNRRPPGWLGFSRGGAPGGAGASD